MTRNQRLIAAAKRASYDLPRQYRVMIECLLAATGKPIITLMGR